MKISEQTAKFNDNTMKHNEHTTKVNEIMNKTININANQTISEHQLKSRKNNENAMVFQRLRIST